MHECLRRFIGIGLVGSVLACGDPNPVVPANTPNVESEVTLFAVRGTPVASPSAFVIIGQRAVRLDQTSAIDFLFDFNDAGEPVFIPSRAAGFPELRLNPGIKRSAVPFDELEIADTEGYSTLDTLVVEQGGTYLARTAIDFNICFLLLPLYAKLEVTTIDHDMRTVTFRVLTDNNCGFRGLLPGLPER